MGTRVWYGQSLQLRVLWKVPEEASICCPMGQGSLHREGLEDHFLTLADPEPLPQSEPQFSLQSEP